MILFTISIVYISNVKLRLSIGLVVKPKLVLVASSGTNSAPPNATASGSSGRTVPSCTCIPVGPSNDVTIPV